MFELFCVDGFWNNTLFLNNSYVFFTNCFQFSLILIASLSFLTMIIILFIIRCNDKNKRKRKNVYTFNFHRMVEFILPIFSAMFSIIDMMNEFYYSETKDPFLFLSFIGFSTSLIIAAVLVKVQDDGKSPIDYIIFMFWWLALGAYGTRFYGNLCKLLKESNMFAIFILINSTFLMFTLLLSLTFYSFRRYSNEDSEKYKSPEEESSVLSQITYSWMDRYIYQWFKDDMKNETAFDLPSEFQSKINTENVEKTFSQICPEIGKQNAQKLLFEDSPNDHRSTNSGMILFKSLFKNYYHLYIMSNVLKLIRDVLLYTLPLLMQLLLEYINAKEKQDTWKGFLFAFIFLFQGITIAILENYSYIIGSKIMIKVRGALLGMIYKKILKLNIDSRRETNDGDIVNFCSVDMEKLHLSIYYSSTILSTPFQIILVTGLLYQQIALATFSQFLLMILNIPLMYFLGNMIGTFLRKELRWKDERMNLLIQIIKSIKIIKMYTWEEIFCSKLLSLRNKEMKNMAFALIGSFIITFLFSSLAQIVAYLNLVSYLYLVPNANFTTEKVFVTLIYSFFITSSISLLPEEIGFILNAFISLKRIEKFLLSCEIEPLGILDNKSTSDVAIDINNGSFVWNKNDDEILTNINLAVGKGKLVAVVGKVGVGKSTLLSTILGETYSLNRTIKTQGSFALVSQEAWIQNMSLRDNILFTKEYNESFYNIVTKACCLDFDISNFPKKDESEIGEGGINLSGGQKQRISLARAIYQDSDIYLLDDPLSAVDIKVGEQLFNNIIGKEGLLKHKTRILVVNELKWLPFMDEIVFINSEGKISERGTFEHLMNFGREFEHFIRESNLKQEKETRKIKGNQIYLHESNENLSNTFHDDFYEKDNNIKFNEEEIMVGNMNWKSLLWYYKEHKIVIFILSIMICAAWACLDGYGIIWLSRIPYDGKFKVITNYRNNTNYHRFYINIFGLIVFGQVLLSILFLIGFLYGGLTASKKMFEVLIKKVLYANLSFFDFTSSGRILNRLGKDLFVIDHILTTNTPIITRLFFILVMLVILIIVTLPWFGLVCIPIMVVGAVLLKFYISTSRQCKRLDSQACSFLFTNVVETYNGSSTIKAFKAEQDFHEKQYSYIDNTNKFLFIYYLSTQWFFLRIHILCDLFVFSSIIFIVLDRRNLDPGLVGLSITNPLRILTFINNFLIFFGEFEVNSVSVERIQQYNEISTECERDNNKKFPKDWNPKGNISFEQFSMRYHEDYPLVLKNISLNISGGEKVGIVGRTGAGKSSLTLALLRLLEGCDGEIFIDGINIKSVQLKELRKQITVLPQDPVIFHDTLRRNLDPFNEYSTEQIIRSLEISGLMEWVDSLKENIDYNCERMGNNLSVGQKQLLCLARTILKKTKIIIIDEATAFVDEETGQKVMDAVKSQFADSTVIIIAHRINTIINCDKILLLDNGHVLEYGSPKELMSKDNGVFKSMVLRVPDLNDKH